MGQDEQKAKCKFFSGLAVLAVIAACQTTPHKEYNTSMLPVDTSSDGRETAADEAINSVPEDGTVESQDANRVTNAAANEVKAHDFVEIAFDLGSATLSLNSRNSLNALLNQSSNAGKIEEILVMSWADDELPSKDKKKLSRLQRDLASKRNSAIRDYLRAARSGVDIDTYNMAKQPNALSRMFNTTNSRLKKSLVDAGLPTTADDPQYPSKASHAVILVKVE